MKIDEIKKFTRGYIDRHPAAGPKDVYKLIYQSFMGVAHILKDYFHAENSFVEEFEAAAPIEGEIFESLLPDSGLVRVNFSALKASAGDSAELWKALTLTLKIFEPDAQGFITAWKWVSEFLVQCDFDRAEIEHLDSIADKVNPEPVHHSMKYVREENPSYRVVSVMAIEGIGGTLWELYRETIELQEKPVMPDVAADRPENAIDIDMVGIGDLSYPIVVLDRENKKQRTVAEVMMSVELPARWRGTHMSRFIEILNRFRGEITHVQIKVILDEVLHQFDARAAHITLKFPYFLEKKAPVSGAPSIMEYNAVFDGAIEAGIYRFKLGVTVPVMTLCPCSKEICDEGAHSQRAHIHIETVSSSFLWIEELVEIAERAASAPVFPLLKREDEKFITEMAYENPRFVEDVARSIARELGSREDIDEYMIHVTSDESIHNHSAFARISGGKAKR